MLDVTHVTSRAEATVTIGVAGAPPLKASYQERHFLPEQVMVTYLYKPQQGDDGWTAHRWVPVNVSVVGPRILKPAPDGTQRLGVEGLRYHLSYGEQPPEWLAKIVNELAPSGDIALAGE